MLSYTTSAKRIGAVRSNERFKRSAMRLAEVVKRMHVLDFKRFFTARNILFVFILLYLHYLLSDGTLIDFIKQLVGWLIVPFLSRFIKPKP